MQISLLISNMSIFLAGEVIFNELDLEYKIVEYLADYHSWGYKHTGNCLYRLSVSGSPKE